VHAGGYRTLPSAEVRFTAAPWRRRAAQLPGRDLHVSTPAGASLGRTRASCGFVLRARMARSKARSSPCVRPGTGLWGSLVRVLPAGDVPPADAAVHRVELLVSGPMRAGRRRRRAITLPASPRSSTRLALGAELAVHEVRSGRVRFGRSRPCLSNSSSVTWRIWCSSTRGVSSWITFAPQATSSSGLGQPRCFSS